ncbi:MAG: sialate O-acetylesterase, partial [Planctomycetota bacterium]
RYEERFSEWQRSRDRARESGDPVPPAPPAPRTPSDPHPVGLYNAMLAPLIPWSIRGAIWYQGESNAGQAELYRRLFPAMIDGWRDEWGRDFPFYFVQLPNYDPPDGSLPEHVWARIREAQSAALDLPRTGMAVTIDVGDTHDLHPPDKLPVGERLARLALHDSYGEEISARSPMLDSVRLESEEVRVHFTNVDGGLVIHGDTAQGFELLSEGGDTIPVTARAEGESVMLGIRGDREPAEVRYAWANAPDANLYSTAGLPAAPFRTKL